MTEQLELPYLTQPEKDEVIEQLEKVFVDDSHKQIKRVAKPYCDCQGKMVEVPQVNDECSLCKHDVFWAFMAPTTWTRSK